MPTDIVADWCAELGRLRAIEKAAREAGFLDEHGNFRLPTSALFRTRDGAIVKPGELVYHIYDRSIRVSPVRDGGGVYNTCVDQCYKSRQAANEALSAARGGGK